MNILIVHPQMVLYGGAEVVVTRLAEYLQKHKHFVTIATLSKTDRPEYKGLKFILPHNEGERIEYRLRDGHLRTFYDISRMVRALSKLVERIYPIYDVINAHNFPAIWASPKSSVWVCNELPDLWHSSNTNILTNYLFEPCRKLDSLVVRSKHPKAIVPDTASLERFVDRYHMQAEIIPYGIDGEFFAYTFNEQSAIQFQLLPKDFVITHAAMVSPSKQQMSTLIAARELRNAIPNLKVVFAGYREYKNPYMQSLKRYVDTYHLQDIVKFTGHINRVSLSSLYHLTSVAVFPGKGQGSWLGPFEALAAGCPVIVSPHLTCSSTAKPYSNVTDNLASAIYNTYQYRPLRVEQAKAGQKFVINELTWEKYNAKVTRILESSIV